MNKWRNIRLIWFKELRSLKRDKKALITIFLPIVIYPVIMMFFFGLSSIVEGNLSDDVRKISYLGEVSTAIQEAIETEGNIEVVPDEILNPQAAINDSLVDLVLEEDLKDDVRYLKVFYNSTMDKSNRAKNLVFGRLKDYKDDYIEGSIQALELDQDVLELVSLEKIELTEESASSRLIASVLGLVAPFILIMYSIIGIYSISSDLSAGEKERFTLETIFSVPIPKEDIIIGKLFAGVSVGLLSGLTNVISMFPIAYAIAAMIPDLEIGFNPLLPVFILGMLLPVMLLTCAVMLGLGLFARTYQEAQTYGSFVMMAFMLPGYIGMIPDIPYSLKMAMLPITNAMLAMREAFVGNYNWPYISLSFVLNSTLAFGAVFVMARMFSSERVIFSLEKGFKLKQRRVAGGSHE